MRSSPGWGAEWTEGVEGIGDPGGVWSRALRQRLRPRSPGTWQILRALNCGERSPSLGADGTLPLACARRGTWPSARGIQTRAPRIRRRDRVSRGSWCKGLRCCLRGLGRNMADGLCINSKSDEHTRPSQGEAESQFIMNEAFKASVQVQSLSQERSSGI